MAYISVLQLIVLLKNTGPTILALTAHQTPTFTGWSRTFVGWMWILWTPVAHILHIYVSLKVKPRFIRNKCQLQIDLAFDNRRNQLQK
jgi:hypothetical protein